MIEMRQLLHSTWEIGNFSFTLNFKSSHEVRQQRTPQQVWDRYSALRRSSASLCSSKIASCCTEKVFFSFGMTDLGNVGRPHAVVTEWNVQVVQQVICPRAAPGFCLHVEAQAAVPQPLLVFIPDSNSPTVRPCWLLPAKSMW